jgi:ABC-2 type transport system ATP-binding protein
VVGPHEAPIWLMQTPDGGIPVHTGSAVVDFTVPRLPPLLGAFAVLVDIADATTGIPITSRRFDDLFGINGTWTDGLVKVEYEVRPRT